jgi:hypothetical protein
VTEGGEAEIAYLTMEDFYRAAAEALGTELAAVRTVTNDTLAGSALAAPSAGFGDFEKYPEFATKTAVLLQAVASNHALPDGNKRAALLRPPAPVYENSGLGVRNHRNTQRCCAPSSSPL